MGQVLNHPFSETNQGLCFRRTLLLQQEIFGVIYAALCLKLVESVLYIKAGSRVFSLSFKYLTGIWQHNSLVNDFVSSKLVYT
jgi:hypothetical protein